MIKTRMIENGVNSMDLRDKINKLSLQAQTTPLGTTCDTRLLFEVLNEVEEILDVNPSKALYELDNMANYRIEYSDYLMPIKDTSEYKTIRQALLKEQLLEKENHSEELEILSILKEHRINIDTLYSRDFKNVNDYNLDYSTSIKQELTRKKFYLIMKWLGKVK